MRFQVADEVRDDAPVTAAGRRDGFIVVATLWILIALTSLVSIYAVYVVNSAYAVGISQDRPQAEALVSAALELAAYQLTSVEQVARPSSGGFRFRMNQATVTAEYRSEAARIDLNFASKELLTGLFTALGTALDAAENYADRVVAWRSPSPNLLQDEEAALYRAAGRSYVPRRAPFPHVGEIALVLGPSSDLIERAMPFLTVFNGQAAINVPDAASQVIAALPGVTPDRLLAILTARSRGVPGEALLDMLGPARGSATLQGTPAVRVLVLVQFDNGRQGRFDTVILLLDNARKPYRILSWRSDYDIAQRTGQ